MPIALGRAKIGRACTGGPRFIGRAGGDDGEVHDPHSFTSEEWERLANAAW